MFLALVGIVISITIASAESSKSVEQFLKVPVKREECEKLRREISPWDERMNPEGTPLNSEEVSKALSHLAKIPLSEKNQNDLAVKAVRDNIIKTWLHFSNYSILDCVVSRLNLYKLLIKAANSSSPDVQKKISKGIRAALEKPRVPTFVNVSIDLMALNMALDAKVFSASPEQLQRIKNLKEYAKKKQVEISNEISDQASKVSGYRPDMEFSDSPENRAINDDLLRALNVPLKKEVDAAIDLDQKIKAVVAKIK